MEYYLPDELIVIGCRHRTGSLKPERKRFCRETKNMCWTPFSCSGGPNGPTERAQNKVLFDGVGHHCCRRRWTLNCAPARCVVSWHVRSVYRAYGFGWRGPRFWMDPNTFLYLGTERTTMNRLVAFRSVPQGRIGLRHAVGAPGGRFRKIASSRATAYNIAYPQH